MAAPIELPCNFDAEALRALVKASCELNQLRRLLSLAEIYDGGSRSDVIRVVGVGLKTARDWLLRFKAAGPESLIDPTGSGRPPKLTAGQRQVLAEITVQEAEGKDIEIWFQDEARIGQENKTTRRWAKRGTQPSAAHDQRTCLAYIFGAIYPKRGKAARLVLPCCDSQHL